MGACCGKGSKTKDPDKVPYGVNPADPSKPATEGAPTEAKKAKYIDVPEIKVNERTPEKRPTEHEDKRPANEASPISITVNDPRESIANGLSPTEDTLESAAVPENVVNFGDTATSEPPRLSDFIPPDEEANIPDTTIEERTFQSEQSSTNTSATEDTDVGQVVLHIDESALKTPEKPSTSPAVVQSPPPPLPEKQSTAPPLPAKHGSSGGAPPLPEKHAHIMPTSYSSNNTGLPPPLPEKQSKSPMLTRKGMLNDINEDVEAAKETELPPKPPKEAIPDPHAIIENVRHKTKDGDFSELKRMSTSKSAQQTTVTKVTIQENKDSMPPLKSKISLPKTTDANQNESMAILGALKMIRNSSVESPVVTKEVTKTSTTEAKTVITGTKKDVEKIVETKVSQESDSGVSTKTTVEKTVTHVSSGGEVSRIPVSPIRKEFSVKGEITNKTPSPVKEVTGGSFKLQSNVTAPLVNGSGTTEAKNVLDSNLAVVEDLLNKSSPATAINRSKIQESCDVKDISKQMKEENRTSTSSISSDESSDLEGGYVLIDNKKASVLELLPDFKPANDDIKYKHTFCPNTRLSTLRTIENWMTTEEEQQHCMVIKAAPGMGKTSLLKEVCSKYSLQLLADHFFSHCSGNLGHANLRQVVLSLAHSFTEKLDNYVGCLPTLEEVQQVVHYGSTVEVLDMFIYNALSSEGLGQEEDRTMLIVLDGLDDCCASDREVLFTFLNEFTEKAPKWLYLLASIQDENQLTSCLKATVTVIDLKNNAENMADMKKIMKESLSPFMDRISLDGGLTQLAKKSNGLALTVSLYNRMLNNMDRQKGIALREIDIKFPTGISGILKKLLKDFKSILDREADAIYFYNTLLGILCFAKEPIHASFAEAIDLRNADKVWKVLSVIVDTHGPKEDLKSLHHKSIAEWLLNEKLSGDCQVDGVTARNEMGRLLVNWITPMLDQAPHKDTPVTRYTLKHSVSHLTDIPKQQENIGNILCSLKATQMKLKLNEMNIFHVVNEYSHSHTRIGDSKKEIVLKDYMKKVPKLSEQLNLWFTFLVENQIELFHSPNSVYQLAANYVNRPRVQQNARVELANQPWLEDISTCLADNVDYKVLSGQASLVDVSPDGKTMAVIFNRSEESVQLVQYSTATWDEISSVDITSLEDRRGLCCTFLPDNVNLFVGSLIKYVNTKGKIILSGFDLKSLPLKQKYTVECCTVSNKYLATSLTTFPWGGRSVHLTVFGLKEKKVVKTLEVLNFRFGGSAHFGTRCCAISPDEKQIVACVKDSNKKQLKVNVWNTGKWNIAHTFEVSGENIQRCHFFETDCVLLDVKAIDANICRTHVWSLKKLGPLGIVGRESASSVSCTFQSKCSVVSWDNKNKGQVSLWNRGQVQENTTKYRFSGMQITDHVVFCHSYIICLSTDILQIFNLSDAEAMDKSVVELGDLNINDVTFMPKSDTSVLSHVGVDGDNDMLSIFNCDTISDDISVTLAKVPEQPLIQSENLVYSDVFQSSNKPGKKCYISHDGKYLIMCYGNGISLWNDQTGKLETLPFPVDIDSDQLIDMCIPSAKEPILAVVYKQHSHSVILFDLRTKKQLRRVGLEGDELKAAVTDMTFMPHNGALISYHRNMEHKLVVWNQNSGAQHSSLLCKINFCRVSSSSDRFILSCRKMESGHLQLRNSEGKFSIKLQTPETWSFQRIDFDLEFSSDGTVLAGVQSQGHMTRIWNAGNGEVLKDFTLGFIGSPSIVGMITNTHMAIYDGRILVIDIASAELLSVTPVPQPGHVRHSIKQLSVSPRGNIIAGLYSDGAMIMLKCHNFSSIKRKTTLQRMKSFSGPL